MSIEAVEIDVGWATNFLLNNYADVTETGCWLWLGKWDRAKYGRVYRGKKSVSAHRFFFTIHKGRIPKGMCVCHRCDTPACVNPSHLFLGTQKENVIDRYKKGRFSGYTHPRAKLTFDQINLIRSLNLTNAKIAELYGVSRAYVSKIKCSKTWEDLRCEKHL